MASVTLSRTSVPAGGLLLFWSVAGDLPDWPNWLLSGPSGKFPAPWASPSFGPQVYWDHGYRKLFPIPAAVEPGLYTLSAGGTTVPFTVNPGRPKPNYARLSLPTSPGVDLATMVEKQLGKTDVELLPGVWEFSRPVRVPDGRRVKGWGSLIEAPPGGAFHCGDDATLTGLEVRGEGGLFAEGSTLVRLSLVRCVFHGLSAGFGPDLVTIDCAWDRCGIILGGDQMLIRPLFLNKFAGNSCLIRGPRVSLIDPVWRDADRGPIFQPNDYDCSDCLIVHPVMTGLCHEYNGCEGVAAEAPLTSDKRFDRNVVLRVRYEGDGPAFQIANVAAADNVVREFSVKGGGGIVLDGGPKPVERTQFAGGELVGTAGVYLGKNVKGTRWNYPTSDPYWPNLRREPTRLLSPLPNRGNQYGLAAPAGWRPVRDDGEDNDTTSIEVVREHQEAAPP